MGLTHDRASSGGGTTQGGRAGVLFNVPEDQS